MTTGDLVTTLITNGACSRILIPTEKNKLKKIFRISFGCLLQDSITWKFSGLLYFWSDNIYLINFWSCHSNFFYIIPDETFAKFPGKRLCMEPSFFKVTGLKFNEKGVMPRVFFTDVLSNFHDSYIFKTPLTSVSVIYFSEIFVNIGVL